MTARTWCWDMLAVTAHVCCWVVIARCGAQPTPLLCFMVIPGYPELTICELKQHRSLLLRKPQGLGWEAVVKLFAKGKWGGRKHRNTVD